MSLLKGAQYCATCGSPAAGQAPAYAVPYMLVPVPTQAHRETRRSVGTAPFVLGLVGLLLALLVSWRLFCLVPALVFSLPGVVPGILALALGYSQRSRLYGLHEEPSTGLLTSGLIFGWIVVGITVCKILLIVVWMRC